MISLENRANSQLVKEPAQINGSRDRYFFCALYCLTTGKSIALENFRLLSSFINLTLNQTSGGYDELADKLIAGEKKPSYQQLSRTYWPAKETKLYNCFFHQVKEIYPEGPARQTIMKAVKNWYKAFHSWESAIRGIEPSPGTKTFVGEEKPVVRRYREATNRAYSLACLQIINPQEELENQRLNEKIFYPVLMMYQATNDFGQVDLPCQKTKMTMDKLTGRNYGVLPLLKKFQQTFKDCQQMIGEYPGELRPPVKQVIEMANLANFFYNFLRFSVLRDQKGRYTISLTENLDQYAPAGLSH
jgi:hypothetical protein